MRANRTPNPHTNPHAFKSSYYVEREGYDADIKVDWDTQRNPIKPSSMKKTRAWLDSRGIRVLEATVFKTAKGWHLRAWTEARLGAYTTLRVQSMLDDDPVRQLFNARRVRRKEHGWNVLWNAKFRNGRNIYREERDKRWTRVASSILVS